MPGKAPDRRIQKAAWHARESTGLLMKWMNSGIARTMNWELGCRRHPFHPVLLLLNLLCSSLTSYRRGTFALKPIWFLLRSLIPVLLRTRCDPNNSLEAYIMPSDSGHSLSVLFKVGQAGAAIEEQKALENQNTFVAWSKMSAQYGLWEDS